MHRRIAVALVLCSATAMANSGGTTGYSGREGEICSSCHTGSGKNTPAVTLSGPKTLEAGTVAEYTFTMVTRAAGTGMSAASTEGTLIDDPRGKTSRIDTEIVHLDIYPPVDGSVVYTFSLEAPPYGGKLTLYAAGNAVNDDGQRGGDDSAGTELEIDVDGPPRPPPPPPREAGGIPAPAPRADASADAGTPPEEQEASASSEGGCAATPSPAPAASLGLALLGLAAMRRRRPR